MWSQKAQTHSHGNTEFLKIRKRNIIAQRNGVRENSLLCYRTMKEAEQETEAENNKNEENKFNDVIVMRINLEILDRFCFNGLKFFEIVVACVFVCAEKRIRWFLFH